MQPQKDLPADLGSCKDKFLVQTVALDDYCQEISPELFELDNASNISDWKIKVIFLAAPDPPSPISELDEKLDPGLSVPEVFELRDGGHENIRGDNFLQDSHGKINLHPRASIFSTPSVGHEGLVSESVYYSVFRGFTFFHLLVTGIFCFFVGHYINADF